MYKITKDGEILTVTSRLVRCRMQQNGVAVLAREDETDAPGIIVNGTIYNLPGYETAEVEALADDRPVIQEIIAGCSTTEDVYMALAELGQLIAGGADNG